MIFFLQIAPELNDMDSLQSAIDNGISMLNKCYERVPLDLDDSDEEDDPDKKWLDSLKFQFISKFNLFLFFQSFFSTKRSISGPCNTICYWIKRVERKMAYRTC